MLNSNERRPAFDAFFASLDTVSRGVFLDDASNQRDALQESSEYPVSIIDCMENVWDWWRELQRSEVLTGAFSNEAAVQHLMRDPERIARERAIIDGTFFT